MKKHPLPLYVALDIDTEAQALALARKVAPYVEGFKIGPRLFFKSGKSFISKMKVHGKVFLDFKFFDIPSSVRAAVQAAWEIGVDLVTVHAQVGEESLRELADLEYNLRAKRDFRILAVTVLTSFSQSRLPPFSKAVSLFSQVESLSDLTIRSGLSSLVCAGSEVGHLRKRHKRTYLLTPGIRLESSGPADDQRRVWTAAAVLKAGASAFVMGRPIYASEDPVGVCVRLQNSLEGIKKSVD